MFFESGFFWFLMGILFVLVAAGFKALADDREWEITWWKALLGVIWYGIFSVSFLAWGTLIGEGEGGAGFNIFLLGMVISLILGVGLWRLMSLGTGQGSTAEE